MNEDLKIIKKKYGEDMMHFCRDAFPSAFEEAGLLSHLLLDHFASSHELYNDIMHHNLENVFKQYIYSLLEEKNELIESNKTPEELLDEVGYVLYECKCEEDIQSFKKYYAKGEELCTFNGERLNRCHVFFAVKKDVDKIKREDFKHPERQDEYGTSVISIQFTKDASHTLSIKNRYNHTVENPDATYSNNLDNIISGLTVSFAKNYGLKQEHRSNNFEIPGYVFANDGKFYKYNYEIHNIYYCPNNIIIDNFEVKQYEKEKYIIMDYFILDLQIKSIMLYDFFIRDSFVQSFKKIEKIEIKNKHDGKIIYLTGENRNIVEIKLDKYNNIIEYENKYAKKFESKFLAYNKRLKYLNCPNLEIINDAFLYGNYDLEEVYLPKVTKICDYVVYNNLKLKTLTLPNVREIGYSFLRTNNTLTEMNISNVQKIGDFFLQNNKKLTSIYLPEVLEIGNCFLQSNENIKKISLPKAVRIRSCFLEYNKFLNDMSIPNVVIIGDSFLRNNLALANLECLKLASVGDDFLFNNIRLKKINIPELYRIGNCFLHDNNALIEINLPNAKIIGNNFLTRNSILQKISAPLLEIAGSNFLSENTSLQQTFLPNLLKYGHGTLQYYFKFHLFLRVYSNRLKKQFRLKRLKKIY